MGDVEVVIAEYERLARANRPDWEAFIHDAKADPEGVAYEMADVAGDLSIALTLDEVFDFALPWVEAL